ncbi:hypothetical protein T492DRAFT_270991 [Pavlovales sp. CCMP2436]|nr:hypothetical protein T492DRAFT_270991 [Pavlovales sp. CCMP2436]
MFTQQLRDMHARCDSAERRAEQLVTAVPDATRPLLAQLAAALAVGATVSQKKNAGQARAGRLRADAADARTLAHGAPIDHAHPCRRLALGRFRAAHRTPRARLASSQPGSNKDPDAA